MNNNPSTLHKVYFSDCDMFGHLNNARYIDYFINVREDHLRSAYNIGMTTYFQQELGWFIGSHQISYLRPAKYDELIKISSLLLLATQDFLLVEMIMTDEKETHLKALLWTRFIPVNIKTGKKQKHPNEFMAFAKSIEISSVEPKNDFDERLKFISSGFAN
ncbi:MAG TPA: acyl-CoA thioesterase [Niabella sp.]|nr:acyl-CoA thioesterase [Niabella sp.]